MCYCWFWLRAQEPCLRSFLETRRQTHRSREGEGRMKTQTFSPSLINSDSLAPWAFSLSAAPAISGSVNWGQGRGCASGNSQDGAGGGGKCPSPGMRASPLAVRAAARFELSRLQLQPHTQARLSPVQRWAGAQGFQTKGPRPPDPNCINTQSRGGHPACPQEQSCPVLTACFPPAAPPFHLSVFPRDAGLIPGRPVCAF